MDLAELADALSSPQLPSDDVRARIEAAVTDDLPGRRMMLRAREPGFACRGDDETVACVLRALFAQVPWSELKADPWQVWRWIGLVARFDGADDVPTTMLDLAGRDFLHLLSQVDEPNAAAATDLVSWLEMGDEAARERVVAGLASVPLEAMSQDQLLLDPEGPADTPPAIRPALKPVESVETTRLEWPGDPDQQAWAMCLPYGLGWLGAEQQIDYEGQPRRARPFRLERGWAEVVQHGANHFGVSRYADGHQAWLLTDGKAIRSLRPLIDSERASALLEDLRVSGARPPPEPTAARWIEETAARMAHSRDTEAPYRILRQGYEDRRQPSFVERILLSQLERMLATEIAYALDREPAEILGQLAEAHDVPWRAGERP